MLQSQQWYQSLDLFSYILDAITEKSKLYCCLDNGLVEFTHGIDESKVKCNQLVELVHAVDELDPLTGYLRVQVLELVQNHYLKLFWSYKNYFLMW